MALGETYYRAAERRVELLILVLGIGVALIFLFARGWAVGLGVLAGSALGWINYRWLKQGVSVFAQLATAQAGAAAVRIPKRVYFKFFGRYALLIAALYGIFSYSLLPAGAVLGGLFSPIGAVVLEALYEIVVGGKSGE